MIGVGLFSSGRSVSIELRVDGAPPAAVFGGLRVNSQLLLKRGTVCWPVGIVSSPPAAF